MAGLFERMGLVRTEYEGMPEIPMQPVSEPMYAPETPVIDATQVSYDDVIASIYQQGDIDDENSIFKIKAYIDILPQDMTKAKKQASIAGILSVNGINVDDLIEDGLKRGRALDAAEDSIRAENDALIAETEADIEHLKSLIEQAEARIEESKQKTSDSSAAIQKEKEAISQLLEFANGVAGMEDLMAWLERSDFYTAPASTRFHGNYTGGLLEHSLNVYDKLSGFVARYPELEISPETVAVTALFHDLTKVNYYTVSSRNVKDDVTGAWHKEPFYKTEDRLPLGHGEKSVIILQSFIKLTRDEIVAIRWHMGSFDCAVKGGDYGMGNAFETYPLAVMTHLADMEATYLVEGLAAK